MTTTSNSLNKKVKDLWTMPCTITRIGNHNYNNAVGKMTFCFTIKKKKKEKLVSGYGIVAS